MSPFKSLFLYFGSFFNKNVKTSLKHLLGYSFGRRSEKVSTLFKDKSILSFISFLSTILLFSLHFSLCNSNLKKHIHDFISQWDNLRHNWFLFKHFLFTSSDQKKFSEHFKMNRYNLLFLFYRTYYYFPPFPLWSSNLKNGIHDFISQWYLLEM